MSSQHALYTHLNHRPVFRREGDYWTIACDARTGRASTTIAGGNVINQTWTPAGGPYIVQGDITIPSGAFLTIQAGTTVRLAGVNEPAVWLRSGILGGFEEQSDKRIRARTAIGGQ